MSKPLTVCADCSKEMRPLKNSAKVVRRTKEGRITEVWSCDVWFCPDCLNKVIPMHTYGEAPLYEHFRADVSEEDVEQYLNAWVEDNGITVNTAEGEKYYSGDEFIIEL